MTCAKCIKSNCKIKESKVVCKNCKNKLHYTKRENHIPIAYICSNCGQEVLIKENKKDNKEQKEIKGAE